MKRSILILIILWIVSYAAAYAQSFDTCMVYADLYNNTLAADTRGTVCIEVVQIIDNTNMWTSGRAEYCVDSTGRVEFPLPQGARAWLYSDRIRGLQGSSLGKEVTVPSSSSAALVDYLPPTPVPPLHTIALNPSTGMISDSMKAMANGLSWLISPAAIAPGTDGYYLKMVGGVPTWAAAAGGGTDTSGTWHASRTDNPHNVLFSQTGAAPDSRLINTTAPITGGGDLSADRTIALDPDTVVAYRRDTSGTFALQVAQETAVKADTAGNFALAQAQAASVAADAAQATADTAGNFAAQQATTARSDLASHEANTSNPHSTDTTHTGAAAGLKALANGTGWKLALQAFNTTGVALGKIPKMGPGGILQWADDSAGSGGGSTVWIDSAATSSDSVTWSYMPSPLPYLSGNDSNRTGFVIMTFKVGVEVRGVPVDFFIRSDSGSGVRITSMLIEWYGDLNLSGGAAPYYPSYVRGFYTFGANPSDPQTNQFEDFSVSSSPSYQYHVLGTYNAVRFTVDPQNTGEGLVDGFVTVWYKCNDQAVDPGTSFLVKITDD